MTYEEIKKNMPEEYEYVQLQPSWFPSAIFLDNSVNFRASCGSYFSIICEHPVPIWDSLHFSLPGHVKRTNWDIDILVENLIWMLSKGMQYFILFLSEAIFFFL